MQRAAERMLELLRDEGVDRIFGNPGTTELPLLDALAAVGDPIYTLALQEFGAVAMAEGYARATGRTAFVNVHAVPGVSNAVIGMHNARRSRTPLVITAGQQDQRHLLAEPMLGGDLVGTARAACKSAREVHRAADLLPVLRRAFAEARDEPAGPVFVSIPMNVLDEPLPGPLPARWPHTAQGAPPAEDIRRAADLLRAATAPAILSGDRVGAGDAVAAVTRLAEALGAPVIPQPQFERVNADAEHPLTAPSPGFYNTLINRALEGHDVIVLAGASIRPHAYQPTPAIPDDARVVQIDSDSREIGLYCPVELGLRGDMDTILTGVADALGDVPGARERGAAIGERLTAERERGRARSRSLGGPAPIDVNAVTQAVADALPDGTAVIEEAITSGPPLRAAVRFRERCGYMNSSGNGGLGWGIGAAVGVQLAEPDRPVVCFLGDGSAMFGLQGLWSAARHDAPVVFVVANNAEYRTLKDSIGVDFAGMDLGNPAVDWPGLAESFGLAAERVAHYDEIGPTVTKALAARRPTLVEIPILGFADGRAARE